MASITLALSTEDSPVPGVDASLCAGLFVMHAIPVREWIEDVRTKHGNAGCVVLADPEWVNPGGGAESLTVPTGQADVDALRVKRERLARRAGEGKPDGK